MKIAIIGAGSSYTPEILEGLASLRERLPVRQIHLMDLDPARLEVMTGFCRRFAARLGFEVEWLSSTDRRAAIEGARFVLTQIRVGGNAARVLDEKIPLRHGFIGQETTGPGGLFKALRTIPAMLEIARDVEALNPEAWIVNYSNPTGLVTEAVSRCTRARIAGLCSGGLFPRWWAAEALGAAPEQVHYDYFGLNHLSFAYHLTVNGRPLTADELARVAARLGGAVDAGLVQKLGLIPSPYLQYYFHRRRALSRAQARELSRGEEVQRLEKVIFTAYADPHCDEKPGALAKRGGGGYSEVALGLMDAIYNNAERTMIVNVPQRGAVEGFPPEAVFELPCLVRADGIHPLRQAEVPRAVWGLVAAVKNYEQLAVDAALSGSRDTALLALLAHPLVGDYDAAQALLEDMLQAHRAYLPQFFAS